VNLAPRLKRALKTSGLKQSELAEKLGVARPTVHAWVHGRAKPHLDTLEKLARILGTTAAELVGGR
jgi:transcriptional regulator with XRE-family HTH domain